MPAAAATRGKRTANDPTDAFFDDLVTRGNEPLLAGATGSLRFDLTDGARADHWHVRVKKGAVSVSKKDGKADAIVVVEKAFFERLVQGRENAMAATLRGVIVVKGDLGLMILFQRIFPGPPASRSRAKKVAAEEGER